MRSEIIDEIKDHIDMIKRQKEALNTLNQIDKIDWQTDINKMEFSKLRHSEQFRGLKYLRVDYIDTPQDISYIESDLTFVPLLELIKSGTKIIPPIYVENVIIQDGVRRIKKLEFFDGSHRQRLSAYLKLPQIPIIVLEKIKTYLFTPGKWSFNFIGNNNISGSNFNSKQILEVKSNDGKVVNIDGSFYPQLQRENTDYIEIELAH